MANIEVKKQLSFKEAQGLSRRERRMLGKLNGVKIPGNNRADLKITLRKKLEEKGLPEETIKGFLNNLVI